MSEIKDIAGMEFNSLLQHVDLGELDVIELRMDRTCQGNCWVSSLFLWMSKYVGDGTSAMEPCLGINSCQGSAPSLYIERK